MADETKLADPLESYQWSVARVDQAAVFLKRFLVTMAVLIAFLATAFLVWDHVSFEDSVQSSVHTLQSQSATYHQDTVNRDSATQCEINGYNEIMSYLAASSADQARHIKPPKFVYPASCE